MSTLYLAEAQLTHLVSHFVGNPSHEEELKLSDAGTRIKKEALEGLSKYLLGKFKPEEFFNFSHPEALASNEVYTSIKGLMQREAGFIEESKTLAQKLYAVSDHPNVKSGVLHLARFEGAVLDGEELDMIGLFKTETHADFLKMLKGEGAYEVDVDQGLAIGGLDKGCLIFDSEADNGYRVLSYVSDKSGQSRFWNDAFLQLRHAQDEFHFTQDVMQVTKEFISEAMPEQFEMSKTDGIDLLNRSVEYFKSNDTFDREDFAQTVLQDQQVIEKYVGFDESYRQQHQLAPAQEFDISEQAVKRNSKVFKSVLKLDKNFHIYVHGDKSLIERGEEEDGRKFYKVYYDVEH